MNKTANLLKVLTSASAVSGDEKSIVNILKDYLTPYGDVNVDLMNNITCTFGEGYHFLLDAHIDEIGFIVTDITDKGFIKFKNVGEIDARLLPAAEVIVWGKEQVRGIISAIPPHLQSNDDEKKIPQIKDMVIDTGFEKAELENIVSLGDRVSFKKNFVPLMNTLVSSPSLDDRAGVASVLLALDELKKLPCKITVLFSSQEEVGLRGAKSGVFDKNPDEAISVDVSFAHTPFCDKADCGEISKGGMIGFSPILDSPISKKLVETAEKNNIPFQREIMAGRTGTNADIISISERGIKTALISVAEKYMHQSVEVVDTKDIENISKLIIAYIKERVGEPNA